jgi:hypothetical protein
VYRAFAEWLAESQFSELLQSWFWIIPTLQIFHILALSVVAAAVWMLNLRLLGVAGRAHGIQATARRFLPWIWAGLAVLAVSGSFLVIAEPRDSLLKPMMQIKLILLVVAIGLTVFFERGISRGAYADSQLPVRLGTKVLGAVSLITWLSIAIAGRLIAYV